MTQNRNVRKGEYIFVYPLRCDFFLSFFLFFLVRNLLPTHGKCWGLLLHLIILNNTHTFGMTPLDGGSARRRDLYLATCNTYKKKHVSPWRDSNKKSQQAIGHRPSLQAARPTGSEMWFFLYVNQSCIRTGSSGPKIHQLCSYLYWFPLHFPARNNAVLHTLPWNSYTFFPIMFIVPHSVSR
jgi:hypothetical protein